MTVVKITYSLSVIFFSVPLVWLLFCCFHCRWRCCSGFWMNFESVRLVVVHFNVYLCLWLNWCFAHRTDTHNNQKLRLYEYWVAETVLAYKESCLIISTSHDRSVLTETDFMRQNTIALRDHGAYSRWQHLF